MQRRSFLFGLSVSWLALSTGPALAQRIGETPVQPAPPDPETHVGEGTVNKVDVRGGKVNMTHDPIASLGWPAMTMDFVVSNREQLAELKPGQRVQFEVKGIGNKYVISAIRPVK